MLKYVSPRPALVTPLVSDGTLVLIGSIGLLLLKITIYSYIDTNKGAGRGDTGVSMYFRIYSVNAVRCVPCSRAAVLVFSKHMVSGIDTRMN